MTDEGILAPSQTITSHRSFDFCLLGGASIAVWTLLAFDTHFVNSHFQQIVATFALLALFFNYPHFAASYRFGYGRGLPFILRHSFSLLVVPTLLIALFATGYLSFHDSIWDTWWASGANRAFEFLGMSFRFGVLANLGSEILAIGIWLMYLTVGWHYSKQVFGCTLVYAKFDRYPFSRSQRNLLKWSVFSVAIFNFLSYSTLIMRSDTANPLHYFQLPITPLGLPDFLGTLATLSLIVSAVCVFYFIGYRNYKRHKRLPTPNVMVAWVAFHLWWIPFFKQPVLLLVVVPFFHALQYLPFVYRLNSSQLKKARWPNSQLALRVLILIVMGGIFVQVLPNALDHNFSTQLSMGGFFTIAFAVFINVHHFFIDSVVWRFDQKEIRNGLLSQNR